MAGKVPFGLQDLIHKLEEGEWVRYIKLAAGILALLAVTALYDLREYKNFTSREAMESAQLARNIAEGRGYVTYFVRPFAFHLLQKHRGEGHKILDQPVPDITTPPVYPMILAGLMQILPFDYEIPSHRLKLFRTYQPERIVAFFNQALFFVCGFVLFRLARRLFDAPAAWIAVVAFLGADLLWRFSVSGLPTMLMLLLFLGICWCLVVIEDNHRQAAEAAEANAPARGRMWFIGMAALTGALVGIGALTRYSMGWFILPVLGFLALFVGQRRLVLVPTAFVAFAVVLTPWIVRNYQVSGTPFGTAGYAVYEETAPFPGNRLERSMGHDFETNFQKVAIDQYFRKLLVNLGDILRQDLPTLGGTWVTAFFLVALLIPYRNPSLSRLRFFVLLCLPVLIVVQALGKTHLSTESPIVNTENLLVLLVPTVFLFGSGMYFILLEQLNITIPPLRVAVHTFVLGVVCAPLILTFLPPRSFPIAYPPYWPPRIQELSYWMDKDELLMSDMPWAVAWYGDRKCMWVTLEAPTNPRLQPFSDFFRINDYEKEIKGLYLTTITTDARFFSQMLKDPDHSWGRFMVESLLRTNVPTGFPLTHGPRGFLQDGHLFLSDRPRWK